MSGEKVLFCGDSLEGPTGFSSNGSTIAWSLADEYDVHYLGLQSVNQQKVKINVGGEEREITQHPNLPRGKQKWDFGTKSLPRLMEMLEPDILLTINDIQMIQHIPNVLYPTNVNMKLMDMPSKKMVSKDALIMELDSHIQRFKEKYPLDCKWIAYCPQDGQQGMPQWKGIYSVADKCIAFAKFGKKVFKDSWNMDVSYIYHGIDTDLFVPKERTQFKDMFVVGNFNRNQPRKQPVRTIQAFAKFAKGKKDVLLHMQMDWNDQFGWPLQYFGEMYGCINRMVRPAPVGIPKNQVAQIYSQWDLNVNTHGGEGMGLTTLEGASCGLPNVITDYTTSKELVIEGKPSPRGTLIPVKELYWEKMDIAAVPRAAVDVDELAKIFEMYYNNRELVKKHGENAKAWNDKYCSIKKIQHQWKKIVKETLNS